MTAFPPNVEKFVQDRSRLALDNLFNKEFSPVEYCWYSARRALAPPKPLTIEQLQTHCKLLFTDTPRNLKKYKLPSLITEVRSPPYLQIRPLIRGSACIEVPREKGGLNYMQAWLARIYDPLKIKSLRSLNVPGLIKGIRDIRDLQIDIIDSAVEFLFSMKEFGLNPLLQVVDLPENGSKHRIPMIPMAAASIAAHWVGEIGMAYVNTIMGFGEAGSGAKTLYIPQKGEVLRSGDALSATDYLDWQQCRIIWKHIVRKVFQEEAILDKLDSVIDILFGPHDLIFLGDDNIDFTRYDEPLAFMAPEFFHSWNPKQAPLQSVRKSDGKGEVVPDHTNMRSNPKDWRKWYNDIIRFKGMTTERGCYMCYKVSFPTLCIINDMGHNMASNLLGYYIQRMITGDDNSSIVKTEQDAHVVTNCLGRLGLMDNRAKTRMHRETTIHAEHIIKRVDAKEQGHIRTKLKIHPKCSMKVLFPSIGGNHWLTLPKEWYMQTKHYPKDIMERGFEYILWKYYTRYKKLCDENICIDWPSNNSIWPIPISSGPRMCPERENLFIPDDSTPIIDGLDFSGSTFSPADVFQINAIGPGPIPRSVTQRMERQLAARYISTLHLTAPTVRSTSTRLLVQDIINRVKSHVPDHNTFLNPSGEPRVYSIIPSLQGCVTFNISKTTREQLLQHYGPITDIYDGSNILKGLCNYRSVMNFLTGPDCPNRRHCVLLVASHKSKWDTVYVRGNCVEVWHVRDEDEVILKMVRKNHNLRVHSNDLTLLEETEQIRQQFPMHHTGRTAPKSKLLETKSIIDGGVEYQLVTEEKKGIKTIHIVPPPLQQQGTCDLCEVEIATHYCANCANKLCFECLTLNHQKGGSRSHSIKAL